MENPNPANAPGSPKERASRRWGALSVFLLLGLVAVVASLAMPRDRTPLGQREAVFPLPHRYESSYTDDWGAAREQGKHEGTDIFAPEGTPIRSITSGTVERARGSTKNGWNPLGGYTVVVEAAYDAGPVQRGDLLYYAHMKSQVGLRPGASVEAGEKLGEVGSTGQGPEGTRGRFEPHLHLGLYKGGWSGDDRPAAPSGAMNPYSLLRWLEEDSRALRPGS